jgi:hypothetical protein
VFAAALLSGQQPRSSEPGRELATALEQQAPAVTAPLSPPQTPGPKALGKIRIGIALTRTQMGQGNTAQSDYGIPVRNAITLMMSGPLLEIAPLDAGLPIQVEAEARQKDCDYIVLSAVTVKHGGGALGKFLKAGDMASNFTSIGVVTHTIPSTDGVMAVEEATYAVEHTASQLSGFNGQIKSKDEVTFNYQLFLTGKSQSKLEKSLKGKSKFDGEDVLSALIQQAASGILSEVTKK